MKLFVAIALLITACMSSGAAENALPAPVTAAHFTELIERPPFRRYLSLSEALVLSGVARLPDGPVVTVWNRSTGETFIVTATPNSQGWKLVDLATSTDLRSVVATIAAGDQKLALRFDPERLTPPKLDNQSKPGRRGEVSLVVEALLRALDPAASRAFDELPAEAQEKFRKSFTEFLAAYPSSSDDKRIAFVQRLLAQAAPPRQDAAATEPDPPQKPSTPPGGPATAQPQPASAAEPGSEPTPNAAPEPAPDASPN